MKELAILNKKILFLCTGNSCRSQIAEALAKEYLNNYNIESAGTNPKQIHPMAIEVMEEVNIDISGYHSKKITYEKMKTFDIVITLCGDAKDNCPNINNYVKHHIHWDLIDPDKIIGAPKKKLNSFRNIRNQIKSKIKELEKQIT